MSITISIKKGDKEKDVVIPVEWKDMTIKYFSDMSAIIQKHHKESKNKKEEVDVNNDSKKDIELNEIEALKMNRDLFGYVSGLTKEEVDLVDKIKINQLLGAINALSEEYEPKGAKSFVLNGEEYFFPSEFFRKETFGDYIESTQLDMYAKEMDGGRFGVLPEQMAILCRKLDEVYDEDSIPAKAEKFREITMDTAWEFAFFLTHQNIKLKKLFPTSFQETKDHQEL